MLEFWFHLVFLWFAVLLPLLAWRGRNDFRRGPGQKFETRQVYVRTMIGQWLSAGALVLVFAVVGIPLQALGLRPPLLLPTLWIVLAIALLLPFGIAYHRRTVANPAKMAKLRARFESFSLMVPMTDAELRGWVALSLTAGVCEEVLYRGFLGFYLGRFMPLPAAAAVASILFGLAHLYQGPRNALRTLLVGAAHWGVYLATGSILPGMVLHALLDIHAGGVLRRAFTEAAPDAA